MRKNRVIFIGGALIAAAAYSLAILIAAMASAGRIVAVSGENRGKRLRVTHTAEYPGMRITDWLDEQRFVFTKANDKLSKINGNYPTGLFLYDTAIAKTTVLRSEDGINFEEARFSRDKKYAAYIKYKAGSSELPGTDMTLCVQDMETGADRVIFQNIRDFSWADDDRIFFDGWDASYIADATGKTENITKKTGRYFNNGGNLVHNHLYYIERPETSPVGGELNVLNLDSGKVGHIRPYAENFSFSPDYTQLAVFSRPEKPPASLAVIAKDGKELKLLAKTNRSDVLMRSVWSRDCIAFSVTGPTSKPGRLYLYSIATGQSLQISGDVPDPEAVFSPSGAKIAISWFDKSGFNSRVLDLRV